jgi:hypothetical protein
MAIFSKKHFIFYALPILVVAVVIGVLIHLHDVHQAQHKSGKVPSISSKSQTSNISSQKNRNSGSSTPTTTTNNAKSGTTTQTPTPSGPIISPSGTFVSNHHPGENGTPTTEESVCNTTPYAQCDIQFTNNGIVKDLGFETTDANGSAFWQWDVNGSDIGPGEWQITAIAKLGNQTVETTDSLKLEVQ